MALSDGVRRRGDGRSEVAVLTHATSTIPHEDLVGPYRLLAFDQVGSTNDEAMARLRAGDPGGLFVTARCQSGGRGRQGRAWTSPPGNLYASLALRLDLAPALAPQLGFVAGVALATTLRGRLRGDTRLRIKWPNDIVFSGAKLSGLLLESTMLADKRIGCVVGFGVNCRSHPDGLAYPATNLSACGDPEAEPMAILVALADAMHRQLARWDGGAGFQKIRTDWTSLAVDAGTALIVALPDRRLEGTFQGLDSTGRLLLDSAHGRQTIDAGDVFLTEIRR